MVYIAMEDNAKNLQLIILFFIHKKPFVMPSCQNMTFKLNLALI